jgi:hypothetical protein
VHGWSIGNAWGLDDAKARAGLHDARGP